MVAIPAYCPSCGHIFEFHNLISVSGGGSIGRLTLENNTVQCPACGSAARLVDGSFSVVESTLKLISGPDITRAMVAQLERIAKRAAAGEITIDEAATQASKINPLWGKLFDRTGSTLNVITGIVSACLAYAAWAEQYRAAHPNDEVGARPQVSAQHDNKKHLENNDRGRKDVHHPKPPPKR